MSYLNQNSSKISHCLLDNKKEKGDRGEEEKKKICKAFKAFSRFLQSSLWAVNALNMEHEWAGLALSFLSVLNSKITEFLSNVIPGHLLKSQHFPQIFRALFCAYFFSPQFLSVFNILYIIYFTYFLSVFLSKNINIYNINYKYKIYKNGDF